GQFLPGVALEDGLELLLAAEGDAVEGGVGRHQLQRGGLVLGALRPRRAGQRQQRRQRGEQKRAGRFPVSHRSSPLKGSASRERQRGTGTETSSHSSSWRSRASTPKSSSVVVSCVVCLPPATSRNSLRMILPERVFGRASVNRTSSGRASGPITLTTCSR